VDAPKHLVCRYEMNITTIGQNWVNEKSTHGITRQVKKSTHAMVQQTQ
jgi:hypothetical protein